MAENKNRHELWQLKQFQALPLDVKIMKSQQRIREWVEHFGVDGVYVAFSGGKDSTLLLNLVRKLYPTVPAVFVNTGLEFIQVLNFIKTVDNVIWLKPKLTFRQVIEKCGYPVISKETAQRINRIKNGTSQADFNKSMYGVLKDGSKTQFKIADQWHYLINAPFNIGAGCCQILKKSPMHKYEKETGRVPFIGTLAEESALRTQQWLKSGCNAFDSKKQVSTPLSFWTEENIWQYLKDNNIPYSDIYKLGYKREGCSVCAFGAHLEKEPTRFQLLQKTHPQLWRHCMKSWEDGGLGLREVLEYIGIPYENFLL